MPDQTTPGGREGAPASRFVPSPPSGMHRLIRAMQARPDLGQVAVAGLVGLLGFTAVLQVRGDDEDLLNRARRADLIQILDGLTVRGDQLERQISELEADRRELASGADTDQASLEQTATLARQLAVLAGTAAATGPGIVVTVNDPGGSVPARALFSAIQELRSAGAEAIEIAGADDQQVRVVASTYVVDDGAGIEIDGVHLEPAYQLTAIGEPQALTEAMNFPQGLVDTVTDNGGRVIVDQRDEVTVDAVHESTPAEYADPAPDDDAG
ncbi:MAG: DUF881 domain-containing protein [Jiangellaceae bacterium]